MPTTQRSSKRGGAGERSSIRAILFDKDGTLVDFDRTWAPAVAAVLRRLAGRDEALYRALADTSGLVQGARFLPASLLIGEPTTVFAAPWAKLLGRLADETFFAEVDLLLRGATTRHLAAIDHPGQVLGALAQHGFRLGLITNDAEATARAHMHKLGLDHLLEFVAGYDSGFGAKPEPRPVLAFAAAMGIAAGEILLVGDTALDVETARAAGAHTVLVLSGPKSAGDARYIEPDAVIASIAALPAWLGVA
jgi:phosphoglycolate phosphatase